MYVWYIHTHTHTRARARACQASAPDLKPEGLSLHQKTRGAAAARFAAALASLGLAERAEAGGILRTGTLGFRAYLDPPKLCKIIAFYSFWAIILPNVWRVSGSKSKGQRNPNHTNALNP